MTPRRRPNNPDWPEVQQAELEWRRQRLAGRVAVLAAEFAQKMGPPPRRDPDMDGLIAEALAGGVDLEAVIREIREGA